MTHIKTTFQLRSLITPYRRVVRDPVEHTNGFVFPTTVKWSVIRWKCAQHNCAPAVDRPSCFSLGKHDVLGCHVILYFSSGQDSILDLMFFRTT